MKTRTTKDIETCLMRSNHKMNTFCCLEVGIVFKIKKPRENYPQYYVTKYETEICDFMTYEQDKDIFKCYEIKVTKQDFYSKAKKTFVGNYNYYSMPKTLYMEVKKDIPKEIGVVDQYGNCLKRPIKTNLKINKEKLLVSMLKSLNRENYKNFYERIKSGKYE